MRNGSDLQRQVGSHRVHTVCEVLPRSSDILDVSLTTKLSFRSYLASHTRDLGGECSKRLNHVVHSQLETVVSIVNRDQDNNCTDLELENLSLDIDINLL